MICHAVCSLIIQNVWSGPHKVIITVPLSIYTAYIPYTVKFCLFFRFICTLSTDNGFYRPSVRRCKKTAHRHPNSRISTARDTDQEYGEEGGGERAGFEWKAQRQMAHTEGKHFIIRESSKQNFAKDNNIDKTNSIGGGGGSAPLASSQNHDLNGFCYKW